jgi:hypothetical protein
MKWAAHCIWQKGWSEDQRTEVAPIEILSMSDNSLKAAFRQADTTSAIQLAKLSDFS